MDPSDAERRSGSAAARTEGGRGGAFVFERAISAGRSLTETGDTHGAIEHLEKTAQIQPENLEVHLALAKAYSKSGRKEDARRERLLCLEMTKNDPTPAIHP